MREGLLCLLSMGEEEGRGNAEGHDGVERDAELGEHGVFLSVGFVSLMVHCTGIAIGFSLQLTQAALQFAECDVGDARTYGSQGARIPWQCQSWVARTLPTPTIPGSANPE